VHGTKAERRKWRVSHYGIHWPDLDEDISVQGLLRGNRSGESRESFKFWLRQRLLGRKPTLADFMKQKKKRIPKTRKKA